MCFLHWAPHWKAAALCNRRLDRALETVCRGPSAQGRGVGPVWNAEREQKMRVFGLRMGCYHIQTPGGQWLDRSIPLATLSVVQEVCMCKPVWVRVYTCVSAHACTCVSAVITELSFYSHIISAFVHVSVRGNKLISNLKCHAAKHWMYYLNMCVCVQNKMKQKRKLYMMVCFTGSN